MRRFRTLLLGVLSLPLALAPASAATEGSSCPSLPAEFAEASALEPRTDAIEVRAIERVDRARVTRAQARKISMLSPVLSAVSISGRYSGGAPSVSWP